MGFVWVVGREGRGADDDAVDDVDVGDVIWQLHMPIGRHTFYNCTCAISRLACIMDIAAGRKKTENRSCKK
jgi:hypothetical protein